MRSAAALLGIALAGVALAGVALAGVALAQSTNLPPAACDNCGVVTSIQMSVEEEDWTPLGVVASSSSLTGTAGAESRSAFAIGPEGNRGLVVIGAAGGAVYARRPNSYQRQRWDVTVKMDRGDTRVLRQRYEPLIREGDRVRVMGTQLELI